MSTLAERYGSRKVTMVGAVIASVGFILSTQARNNEMLIATFGVIGGESDSVHSTLSLN